MDIEYANIDFESYVKKIKREMKGYTRKWQKWCILVSAKDDVLDKIAYVEYYLPPTFPNPEKLIKDRRSKFALGFYSSGSFDMKIIVRFEDGNEYEYTYPLDRSIEESNEKFQWPCLE